MRRADRLFRIVQILRTGRLVTARRLAERLEVAERTIYRDIRELSLSGVPIEGEAGVGYLLRSGFDIPPLMFTREEIEALVAGARMVSTWGGEGLSASASAALEKITAAVPETLRRDAERTRLYALDFRARGTVLAMDRVREAMNGRRLLGFQYVREDGAESRRTVRPLALYFWGPTWTLAAWCELRRDFRNFRVDRMSKVEALPQAFPDEPGKTLADFLRKMHAQRAPLD